MTSAATEQDLHPMDFIKDGIAIFSSEGGLMWADDGLRRILGFPCEPDATPPADVLARIQFGGALTLESVLAQLIEAGTWEGEGVGLTLEDHAVFLEITGRRIDQDAGEHFSSVLIFRNATRQRLMARQVLESQQMELVEKLTRGMAHEFKNLLTIIMAYGSLLELQFEGSEKAEEVTKILETAERANDVTRRMVSVTRRPQAQFENTDLFAVMTEVNALLAKALPTQLTVLTAEPRRMPMVFAETGSLIRAVIHLALNASEAMPEGGDVAVSTDVVNVTAADVDAGHPARSPGQYVMISVTDSGYGMTREVQARLFEPFFTTKEDGSGLGLCFVKKAIEDMNGVLNVYSEPGDGTTVRMYLPVLGGQLDEEQTVLPSGNERVLVVDDDSTAQGIICMMLERVGYTVLKADGGADALARIQEIGDTLDLILLDVVMPDINGYDVCAQVKQSHPDLKVVMTSGFPQETVNSILQQELPMVSKPLTQQVLLSTVRAALDG